MKVESRRLQRLGASSLVVTLPKEWVKRLDLKPGDRVLVYDEGDSVRITPERQTSSPVTIDRDGLNVDDVSRGILCLYIMGYGDVKVRSNGMSVVELSRIKSAAMRLQGVEVVEEDDGSLRLRYVVDPSKVDVKLIVRSIGITVGRAVKLLYQVLEPGEADEEVHEAARSIRAELLRYQHQAMRYLVGRLGSDSRSYALLLGTGLLGLIGDFVVETILAIASGRLRIGEECEPLLNQIRRAAEIVPLLSSVLVNPSLQRSRELLAKAVQLFRQVSSSSFNGDKGCSYLTARFEDIVRTAIVVANIAYCSSFTEKVVES